MKLVNRLILKLFLGFAISFYGDALYALGSMDTPNLLTSHSRPNLFKFSFVKRLVGKSWKFLTQFLYLYFGVFLYRVLVMVIGLSGVQFSL